MQETTEHRRERRTLRAKLRILEAIAEHHPLDRSLVLIHAERFQKQLAQLESEAHPTKIIQQRPHINQYAERQ